MSRTVRSALVCWRPWLITAFCLAPFSGLLLPDGRTLPDGHSRDFVQYQLPIREYARTEILAGRFPLWIPYLCGGLPLHAGQQASLCHPLLTPLVLALGAGYGLKFCLLLHMAIGSAGAYCWSRCLGASRAASGAAGICATWSGFAVNHLMAGHVTLMLQFALVPWFFLALSLVLKQPGPLPAAVLSTIASCFAVSGHPQVFYYSLVLSGLWTMGSLVAGAGSRARGRCLGWGLAAALVTFLASCVQILPSIELARDGLTESFRARSGFARQHALTGLDMLRFAFPDIAGNPFRGPPGMGFGENFHERVVYLGFAAPLLALFGITRGTAARWQWGAAWLLVLSLSISLGDSTPLFEPLLAIVPGLGLFRCPGRVFGVASFLVAPLVARGLDGVVLGETAPRGPQRLYFAALVWCLGSLAGFALTYNKDGVLWAEYLAQISRHLTACVLPPVVLSISTLITLFGARRWGAKHPKAAYVMVVGLICVDLYWNNVRNFHLERPTNVRLPGSLVAVGRPRRFAESSADARVTSQQLRYSHLVPAALGARRQLLGTKEGGILPASTERLFRAIQSRPLAALALAGCDYTCSAACACRPLPAPLPRVRFVEQTGDALVDLPIEKVHDDDLRRMVATAAATPRIVEKDAERIVVDVAAPTAGWLVLADTWYPGWKATVDGRAVDVNRAHRVFRAVKLSQGRHKIIFVYQPASFWLGFAGTCLGVVLLFGLLIYGLKRGVGAPGS